MNGNQTGGNVIYNLDVDSSKFTAGLNKAREDLNTFAKEGDSQMSTLQKTIVNSFNSATQASQLFAAGLIAVGTATVTAAGFGIKYAANLETMRAGFTTLLGSTKAADEAITQIQKDASTTPFTFPGLVNANQLLTSVTKNSGESERLLLNVGKALTAMGKGQPELDRIIVNLQQIGAIGHASAVDIKQFAYAGIPIYDLLNEKLKNTKLAMVDNSKAIGKNNEKLADLQQKLKVAQLQQSEFGKKTKESTKLMKQNQIDNYSAQIAELTGKTGKLTAQNGTLAKSQMKLDDAISNGLITFDLLKETFNEAGEGSGRFAKAFIEQGGTFNQVWSNLQDNIGITAGKIVTTTGIFNGAKLALAKLTDTVAYFASDAGIAKINNGIKLLRDNLPIVIGLIAGGLTPAFIAMLPALIGITASFIALVPYLAIGAAIGLAAKLIIDNWSKIPGLLKQVEQFGSSLLTTLIGVWQIIVNFFTVSIPTFVTGLITSFVNFFKALPQMMASFIWNEIILGFVNFLGLLTGLVIYGVPLVVKSIVDFFFNLPGQILSILTSTYNFIVSTWELIKTWLYINVPLIILGIISFFAQLPGKVLAIFVDVKASATAGIKDTWAAILAEVSTWPDRLYNWGANIATSFANGVKSAIGSIVNAFKDGLNNAKKLLEGHSPPIAGPFKNIDVWGENVGMAWVKGLESAINSVSFDNPMIASIQQPAVQPAYTQGQRGATGPLVTVEHMEVRDESDITDIARELGFRIETSTGYANG